MTWSWLLLVIGFALLVKGADWLVDGASALAKKLGISSLVIGLTVVAFGTSAPELIVNVMASLSGATDIAIGNILGSNIANILLILGVSAVIYPLRVTSGTTWREIPLAILAVVALMFMANDQLFDGHGFSELGHIDGFILIAFFAIFLSYVQAIAKQGGSEGPQVKYIRGPLAVGMVLAGLVLLTLGGKWVVDSATAIARTLGVSDALIGLTIVAVGTSLPELATSVVAALKHNTDIAVGNIVGSNIFNIFWILGLSAVIHPLPFSLGMNLDIVVTLVATLLLFFALFVGKKRILERWQGVAFVLLYLAYIGYLIARG
jgi:cation:H+ antiporter